MLKGKYEVSETGIFVKYYLNHEISFGVIFFHTRYNFIRWKTKNINFRAIGIFVAFPMLKGTEHNFSVTIDNPE